MGREAGERGPHSIRWKLLLPLNVLMVIGLGLLLGVDYQRELTRQLQAKHLALFEEAKTLLPGARSLSRNGEEAVQAFIDDVCGRMRDADSPWHHIVVDLGDTILQSRAHHRASSEYLAAVEDAVSSGEGEALYRGETIIVGVEREGPLAVYIAESVSDIRRSVRAALVGRTTGLAVISLAAVLLINLLLIQLVTRPVGALVRTVREIGRGNVGVRAGRFNTAEFAFVADELSTMSVSLAEHEAERTRQLDKAVRIQHHLQPEHMTIPGLDVAYVYLPATEVAGDYYDAIQLPDGGWLIVVADVSGHGVPAAMGAAVLKSLLLTVVEKTSRPDQVLAALNRRFDAVFLPGDFASMIVLRWQPETGALEYASAGHETCYRITAAGALAPLSSTGTLLGVNAGDQWPCEPLDVRRGDRLLLVTDGVTELAGSDGRRFGRRRLRGLLETVDGRGVDDLVAALLGDVEMHRGDQPPDDDITILAIGVERAPSNDAHTELST